jgi:integrase
VKPLSAQTVKHCLNLLRVCLQAVVEDELVERNPAEDVKPPRELRTEEPWTYLLPEEQDRLVRCKDIPAAERALIEFAIGTGLRQGEQWSLELRDLHVEGEDPHAFVRFGSPGKPPKNGKTRRVPLFGRSLDAAKTWLALMPVYVKRNPFRLVFPTSRGCRRPEGKFRHWRKYLAAAGINRRVRWHDLRHTCASSLVAGWWGRTWRLEEVRDLLGHSSVTVTERYAHLADSALKGAARETQQARGQVTFKSREGQEMSQLLSQVPDFTGRATVDSNHWPSAPEADALSS